MAVYLANEAQAAQSEVEHQQRVDGDGNPVFDDTATTQNANTSGERPGNQDDIDRYTSDPVEAHGGQQGGDDERE